MILKELSAREALLLDTLLIQLLVELKGKDLRKIGPRFPISPKPVDDAVFARFPSEAAYQLAHAHLSQRGLMMYATVEGSPKFPFYHLTGIGLEFTLACQPPAKQS